MKTLKLLLLFVLLAIHCFSQSKEEFFEAGKRDLEEGWPITAVDHFSHAIKLDSTFARAYYYRGLAYLKGARSDLYTPAVIDFYKCITLQPNSNFWQAYSYIADKKLFPHISALKYYTRAIEFNSTNHLLYQRRGFLKQWNGMLSEALADYDKAINLNKHDFRNYEFNASVEIQTGNYTAALKNIDKAIELNPHYAKLYFDKMEILCRLNQVKAAKKIHKKARGKFEKTGESLYCSCCDIGRKQG
jgi:tetratricopeptide (TPR) repeat protein